MSHHLLRNSNSLKTLLESMSIFSKKTVNNSLQMSKIRRKIRVVNLLILREVKYRAQGKPSKRKRNLKLLIG